MTELVALPGEGDETTWEVRRDDHLVGSARTTARRGGVLLKELAVPASDAPSALDGLLVVLRGRGEQSLAVDVVPGDEVLEAALLGRSARLEATQMRLDLSAPVPAPARVTLRPMSQEEFAGYRDQLVTAYAQDMLDAGAFTDEAESLAASERSTAEELPDGAESAGQHLWTAYDGDDPVGILWIHVDGSRGFIFDIEVRAERRRMGYGREVLDAGARAARGLGAEKLGLNVFGHNEGARTMYEQAGYDTTEQTFRIPL